MNRKTARRNARSAIDDEKIRYLAAIVQFSDDAIIGKDLSGLIASWNPAAERLFGYSEGEVLGKPASLLGGPGQAHEFQEIIEAVKEGRRIERYETRRRRKDGTMVDVSVTASAVMDDRDISAQKPRSTPAT